MRRYIWDSPKERQISWIKHSIRKYSVDRTFYNSISNTLKHENGINLDDLDIKTQEILVRKIFFFKFDSCCSNAKYVRCGKKKGYENTKFLLGEWNELFRNLRKHEHLFKTGLSICEKYIRNGFNNDYAPVLHRKSDNGHYEWDNIEIMTRKEHDELTKQERQKKKQEVTA